MKTNKTKFILSICALSVCLLLVAAQVFAWIALSSTASTDGMQLGIVGVDDSDSDISVELEGNKGDGVARLLPGDYLSAKIKIVNNSGATKNYELFILKCTVAFPSYKEGFKYSDKYIDVNSYYSSGMLYDVSYDDAYTADKYSFFRGFVSPVTDAVCYNVAAVKTVAFSDLFPVYNYFTDNGPAEEKQQFAELSDYSPTVKQLPVSSYGLTDGSYTDEDNVTTTVKDGKVVVASGEKAFLYMLIRFDPAKYVLNAKGIELRNSNPYISQKAWITVSAVSSLDKN